METQEQQLIEGLFSRLQEAEKHSAPRDAEAERAIGKHIQNQPAAPYYMAQVILLQEAAIKRLDQRVRDLELQAERAQQTPPEPSGGFLAGLFGGGQRQASAPPSRPSGAAPGRGWGEPGPQYAAPAGGAASAGLARGSGFLGGALQTAAGVAGGMLVGNLLTSMFHQSQPQEIVDVIHEQEPQDEAGAEQDSPASRNTDYAQGEGGQYVDDRDNYQDAGYDQGGFDDPGFDDGGDFSDDGDWL